MKNPSPSLFSIKTKNVKWWAQNCYSLTRSSNSLKTCGLPEDFTVLPPAFELDEALGQFQTSFISQVCADGGR